jgi:signal transduction histidine kinase
VFAVTVVAICVYGARNYTGGPIYIADAIAMYTVASTYDRKTWLTSAGAAWLVVLVASFSFGADHGFALYQILYLSWILAAGFFGDAARSRREHLLGLEERHRQLVDSQEEEARRRVAEERLRIARDLHDVVAHSLSSINIQAGAGAHVADRHPDQALDALLAIKHASSDALGELRATLGMLRADDEAAPRAPVPSLARLDSLVARTAQSGVPVDVEMHGTPTPLPEPVDAAAFRIVQESLTNVLRHAGPTRATVSIVYSPQYVEVDVRDNGIGDRAADDGGGHGIAGMRERAAALGGSLRAAPLPSGGFRVTAHLPTNGAAR